MLDNARTIALPSPRQDSAIALERCIRQRRSVRVFRDQALTGPALGQLLWAAQGITLDDGRRAVPSAGALHPLELYVAIDKAVSLHGGVYHYAPERHELGAVTYGWQYEKLVEAVRGQEWIATASAVVCIAADFERMAAKYGRRGHSYVYIEAGLAAESLMLQAVALGLATTLVGAFDDDEVKRLLHLGANETPVCLIAVGAPESSPEDRRRSENWDI
jgi:SagB-type dehydrogenase family enzyme